MPLLSLNEFTGPGRVVSALQKGDTVSTDVLPEGTGSYVYLTEGDELCGLCGELITGEDYPGASYANVLGRIKHRYGETACEECLPRLKGEVETPEADGDESPASAD